MPAILLRFLPHLAVIAAVLGAIWYLDHRGYERARKDAEFERAVTALIIEKKTRQIEDALDQAVAAIDKGTADQIGQLDIIHRTIYQPTITKELTRETRFTDPDAGLSRLLLDTLNAARAASTCTATASGGISCTLPEPAADPGALDRTDGDDQP